MTVKEFIELLATMPQDAVVLYRCYSDCKALDAKSIEVQRAADGLHDGSAVKHHNMTGEYRLYAAWDKGYDPVAIDAVILPGN